MQTKPLRTYGIDVTQTSMQPILNELGITDRSVKQMSQAEKEILRYIATLRQAQVAMGDMANTIESPSNQMKIFKQQLVEAKVALTSLFIGSFSKILPYANALLMVVKEVSKAIADMFGIELTDYNSGIASTEDAYIDLSDSIDNATDSVKELKRQTLGFDQINNINENKDTGSSVSGGIDQRLLDAISGYDNGMDKVRMKATEIRDRIMEWLGLTKEVDSVTGEVRFKFTDTDSTLYGIVDALGKIYENGKKIVTEVLKRIEEDLDFGWFGKIIVTSLEGIGDALGWISQNDMAVRVITTIVESLLLLKGLNFLTTITGIKKIGPALMTIKGPTSTIIGTAGTGKMAVGATGLLGTLGILTILAETTWLISLATEGASATKEAIESTKNTTDSLWNSNQQLTQTIKNMTEAENVNTEQLNLYIKSLSSSIRHSQEQIDLLDEMKGSSNSLEGGIESLLSVTDNYTAKQDALRSSIENTKVTMEYLRQQGKLTDEQYNIFKETIDNLTKSASKSKEKISETKNKMQELNSKVITLDVDAKTNKFSQKVQTALNNLKLPSFEFGGGSGGGTRANGGIYSNGSWKNIPQYANGGVPSHGTMFVAGEAGAEIVGHINGRTEVLNQSQIASAIYGAVVSAMSQFSGQTNQIDVHVHTDEGTVVDRINQKTKQTGVCPIEIPA